MLKVILNAPHPITPFNEPARDLRIHNLPLWLHQRNILAPYTTHELELKPGQRFPLEWMGGGILRAGPGDAIQPRQADATGLRVATRLVRWRHGVPAEPTANCWRTSGCTATP